MILDKITHKRLAIACVLITVIIFGVQHFAQAGEIERCRVNGSGEKICVDQYGKRTQTCRTDGAGTETCRTY